MLNIVRNTEQKVTVGLQKGNFRPYRLSGTRDLHAPLPGLVPDEAMFPQHGACKLSPRPFSCRPSVASYVLAPDRKTTLWDHPACQLCAGILWQHGRRE